MKTFAFAGRCVKELLRDKLNFFFGIGFPVVLILLLTAIQANIPVKVFELDSLTPGIAVFGLSFISLFSSVMIAKDRTSSFMLRLFTSPMKAWNFILGYTLPLLPISIAQIAVSFLTALFLGLSFTPNLFLSIAVLIPTAVLFIGIGLLCGCVLNEKQAGGVCGALLTNVSAWLSGTWFDLDLVGGTFKTIADLLPFSHAVRAGKYALAGDYALVLPELLWVVGYAVVLMALAVWIFTRNMRSDHV